MQSDGHQDTDEWYRESPIDTLQLLYENGRPITLVAPLIIVSIYYFYFIEDIDVTTLINYILLLGGIICLRTGINNVNNSYDVDADLINKPHRPIPRGDLPGETAFIIGMILQFISLFIFMLLSLGAFLLCLSFVLLGWFYNIDKGLKNIFPLNNLVIGYVRGFGYLLAPLVVEKPISPIMWIFAVTVTFYIFGSVNSKDIKDIEGDKETNRTTLPIILGNRDQCLAIVSAPFILTPVLLLSFMVFLGEVGSIYLLILILLPLDLIIIYLLNQASTNPLTENTTAWLMMIITYLSHHIVFLVILIHSG